MAHKILIMSPLHNMGSTVAASLLAQGLTFDNKSVMLLFTHPQSLMPQYLGIEDINDPTRSIMQVVKLIDNGAINDKDILDYSFSFTKNGYLLNVADRTLNDKDRTQIVDHVYNRAPTNIVVVDNSDDLDTKASQTLIEESDMIFLVVEPSLKAFQRLKLWKESPQFKDNPNIYVIVTHYNEVTFSVRNLAKYIGFPGNRVCKVHYNPWITKCCITGTLNTILPLSRELDPRVANLKCDIDELNQCVNGAIVIKNKKGL